MSRLSSFTLFSNLPPELRLQIWHEAIREEKKSHCFLLEDSSGSLILSRDQISSFLTVSRQSRAVALEAYPTKLHVRFLDSPEIDAVDYEWKGCVYVDFENPVPATVGFTTTFYQLSWENSRVRTQRLTPQQCDLVRERERVIRFVNFHIRRAPYRVKRQPIY
ncbi:hypothetical protein K449DRAFT_438586 [Hypoxylon sp. EC38]|nr:hypothetical protein K449DRAFT_438586 [Hypoxylon sp. EC38]